MIIKNACRTQCIMLNVCDASSIAREMSETLGPVIIIYWKRKRRDAMDAKVPLTDADAVAFLQFFTRAFKLMTRAWHEEIKWRNVFHEARSEYLSHVRGRNLFYRPEMLPDNDVGRKRILNTHENTKVSKANTCEVDVQTEK